MSGSGGLNEDLRGTNGHGGRGGGMSGGGRGGAAAGVSDMAEREEGELTRRLT
jgi:hypothetical protein